MDKNKKVNANRVAAYALSGVMLASMIPYNVFASTSQVDKIVANNAMLAATPKDIATREAAPPMESEVSADARDAVHGWVGIQRTGDVNLNYDNQIGKAFLPMKGVKVYFQWYEDGGKVSPVYTTTSGADGRF
ncbi:MAG: hypothetical protein MR285_03480, partial [Peptoniphilus sp.]|uniref:hypothetical protein n=1 Tax=Peptoniphilus sp. TaxID=1971214 RepID=UPI0025FEDCF3